MQKHVIRHEFRDNGDGFFRGYRSIKTRICLVLLEGEVEGAGEGGAADVDAVVVDVGAAAGGVIVGDEEGEEVGAECFAVQIEGGKVPEA